MDRQQQLSIERQRATDEHSLIENMNNQQDVPQLSPQEIEELNRLGESL